jgi:hypothetical protein
VSISRMSVSGVPSLVVLSYSCLKRLMFLAPNDAGFLALVTGISHRHRYGTQSETSIDVFQFVPCLVVGQTATACPSNSSMHSVMRKRLAPGITMVCYNMVHAVNEILAAYKLMLDGISSRPSLRPPIRYPHLLRPGELLVQPLLPQLACQICIAEPPSGRAAS